MSEKTPRQLGKEAESLRIKHVYIEGPLAAASEEVEYHKEWADYYAQLASGDNTERIDGDATSTERAHKLSERALELAAESQPRADGFTRQSVAHMQKAAEHYEQNAAGYHDLGVLEAAMDDVHINVQKPKGAEEHTRAEQD